MRCLCARCLPSGKATAALDGFWPTVDGDVLKDDKGVDRVFDTEAAALVAAEAAAAVTGGEASTKSLHMTALGEAGGEAGGGARGGGWSCVGWVGCAGLARGCPPHCCCCCCGVDAAARQCLY